LKSRFQTLTDQLMLVFLLASLAVVLTAIFLSMV